jgi:hypothetical protein
MNKETTQKQQGFYMGQTDGWERVAASKSTRLLNLRRGASV